VTTDCKNTPKSYCHFLAGTVIFTLPNELIPLAQNPTVVYNIFFRAISEALLTRVSDTSGRPGD
jgi:hypothetical protein